MTKLLSPLQKVLLADLCIYRQRSSPEWIFPPSLGNPKGNAEPFVVSPPFHQVPRKRAVPCNLLLCEPLWEGFILVLTSPGADGRHLILEAPDGGCVALRAPQRKRYQETHPGTKASTSRNSQPAQKLGSAAHFFPNHVTGLTSENGWQHQTTEVSTVE